MFLTGYTDLYGVKLTLLIALINTPSTLHIQWNVCRPIIYSILFKHESTSTLTMLAVQEHMYSKLILETLGPSRAGR